MNEVISFPTNEKIDSFLSKIRTKSYYLKSFRGYTRISTSREATTIVKAGLFTEKEILDLSADDETIEILRRFDKIENQTFVSAFLELKDAFRRNNARNKVKTGNKVFAELLNDVFSACEDKFEISWSKERERIIKNFNSFIHFCKVNEFDISDLNIFSKSFEKFYFNSSRRSSSLRSASLSENRDFYKELSFYNKLNSKGVENVIDENKAEYLSFLTANLNNAIAKHLPEETNKISNINIFSSAKGYAIEMSLYSSETNIGRLSTRSIPVEGYQVRFHYRYITHVDKFEIVKK